MSEVKSPRRAHPHPQLPLSAFKSALPTPAGRTKPLQIIDAHVALNATLDHWLESNTGKISGVIIVNTAQGEDSKPINTKSGGNISKIHGTVFPSSNDRYDTTGNPPLAITIVDLNGSSDEVTTKFNAAWSAASRQPIEIVLVTGRAKEVATTNGHSADGEKMTTITTTTSQLQLLLTLIDQPSEAKDSAGEAQTPTVIIDHLALKIEDLVQAGNNHGSRSPSLDRLPKAYIEILSELALRASNIFFKFSPPSPAELGDKDLDAELYYKVWFQFLVEAFGPNRLIYGSNWSGAERNAGGNKSSADVALDVCCELGLGGEELDVIFAQNALEAYQLQRE